MQKIYRVFKKIPYGSAECAFFFSLTDACDFIKAQLKNAKKIGGYSKITGRSLSYENESAFIFSLEQGNWWGEMYGSFMIDGYSIETDFLEDPMHFVCIKKNGINCYFDDYEEAE